MHERRELRLPFYFVWHNLLVIYFIPITPMPSQECLTRNVGLPNEVWVRQAQWVSSHLQGPVAFVYILVERGGPYGF